MEMTCSQTLFVLKDTLPCVSHWVPPSKSGTEKGVWRNTTQKVANSTSGNTYVFLSGLSSSFPQRFLKICFILQGGLPYLVKNTS